MIEGEKLRGGKMREEGKNRIFNQKKWVNALAVCLLFAVLFWNTETVREEVDAEARERICQVYCLGDSITYGSGLSKEERPAACYPARLEQLLGARYAVINYGVPGATLLDTPEKSYRSTGYLELTEAQSPDLLILMLGTNDSRAAYWNEVEYKKQCIALIKELQEISSRPYVYVMAPPEAFPLENGEIIYGIDNGVIQGTVREAVRAAAEETGAGFIDLYAVTENHPEYFTDGVHPNETGYALLAETVAERIRQDEQAGVFR